MRDVARLAGVSFKTVSRVVNGEPGVRPETAARVMTAVRALGYRPSVIAVDFARGGMRNHIGVVIDDVSNPFWARVARAIEDAASAEGRQVIIASSDFAAEREHRIIDELVAQRLGGLIIVPVGRDHAYLAREMELGTAMVFLDRPQTGLPADTVLLDNHGGARTATAHLLARGHERVALLAQSMRIYTMTERRRGYADALLDAGIRPDPHLERLAETAEEARAATIELLSGLDPPTAIFCANNRMSVGAISGISQLGGSRALRPRVALVGFDDLELAEALAIPLTVVHADGAELGRVGAELLLKRLAGWAAEPQRIVLPTSLIERGSGELARG